MGHEGFNDSSDGLPASSEQGSAVSRRELLRTGGVTAGGIGLSLLGTGAASVATGRSGPDAVVAGAGAAGKASGASAAAAGDACEVPTPGAALGRLRAGNARWVSGRLQHPHQSVERREEVSGGQCPFAVVVICIDSRVTPEVIFDTGIGDLFVVRTAAQVLDAIATGSVEYGPANVGTPLVVVLGHQRCGAVTAAEAAIREESPLPGHMQRIVEELRPAYDAACGAGGQDCVDRMVRANTRQTVDTLQGNSLLAPLVEKGELDIVGGYYSLDTGRVDFS